MKRWLLQLVIAFDQLANVLLCNGWADETMSSNAFRMHRDGKFWGFLCPLIDWVMTPWERGHCEASYRSEKLRRHMPPKERDAAP